MIARFAYHCRCHRAARIQWVLEFMWTRIQKNYQHRAGGTYLHVDFARLFGAIGAISLGQGYTSRRPQHRHEGDQLTTRESRFGRGPIIDTHALPDGRLLGFDLSRDLSNVRRRGLDALSRAFWAWRRD